MTTWTPPLIEAPLAAIDLLLRDYGMRLEWLLLWSYEDHRRPHRPQFDPPLSARYALARAGAADRTGATRSPTAIRLRLILCGRSVSTRFERLHKSGVQAPETDPRVRQSHSESISARASGSASESESPDRGRPATGRGRDFPLGENWLRLANRPQLRENSLLG